MTDFEPLDARIEYTLWYDNGDGVAGVAEFDNLEAAERFMSENRVYRQERYVGNVE